MAQLDDLTDEQRREWFIENDNHFVYAGEQTRGPDTPTEMRSRNRLP